MLLMVQKDTFKLKKKKSMTFAHSTIRGQTVI